MPIDRRLAEISLRKYIEQAWKYVVPNRKLIWNWHLDVLVEHFEAVTKQLISYLIISIPPRLTKSLISGVFWPTWEWGPQNKPHHRFIYSSYSQLLSTRDAIASRRLMLSEWYKELWGTRFQMISDQNQKTRYDNNYGGYRIATSVEGMGTGEGGDRIIVDDPNNVQKVESPVKRMSTNTWWDESMSTRLDNEITGAYIVIQQRTHIDDLTGHLLERLKDERINYTHLILPMRYESSVKYIGPLVVKDPRTKPGEPLDKNRFPEDQLRIREARMTAFAISAQHQQSPRIRGGHMFKIENFNIIDKLPMAENIKETVRYWDKAGTEDGGKRTAGVRMSKLKNNRIVISDVVKGQWEAGNREKRMKLTAELDKSQGFGIHKTGRSPEGLGKMTIWVEQEPGSGGKESIESTIRNLVGFPVRKDKVTGNKETRADGYATYIENSMVDIVRGPWNQEFIDEHEVAPKGKFQDQWDAAAGAFNKLNFLKSAGVWGRG